ncbi:MAG: DUF1653 domain-containing protein [Paenibacillaceae bacterium]|nr:DUF1653 domain-containing protein [Paenibacillaceae bacterium]
MENVMLSVRNGIPRKVVHFKHGTIYEVYDIALHHEGKFEVVSYRNVETGQKYGGRPIDEFFDVKSSPQDIRVLVPRFSPI